MKLLCPTVLCQDLYFAKLKVCYDHMSCLSSSSHECCPENNVLGYLTDIFFWEHFQNFLLHMLTTFL